MLLFLENHKITITAILLLAMIVELVRSKTRPELVLGCTVLVFVLLRFISVDAILNTLTNRGILIIFLIIAITTAINSHIDIPGNIDRLLGKIKSEKVFLGTLGLCVAFVSSIFNNTPVVILLIPYVKEKSRQFQVSPSRFLIPLSYFAILGGMLTLIGTSTTLLLNGLLEEKKLVPFSFFDFLIPGLLVCFFGITFIVLFGKKLLPERASFTEDNSKNARKFFIEAKIAVHSDFADKTIEASGIKDFRGISLLEIIRGDQVFKVLNSRNLILKERDRLIFSGSLKDVKQLNTATTNIELISERRVPDAENLEYVELSIPSNSYLDGKKIKETNFRQRYGATILAIHRNNEDLSGRIGESRLKSGDLLIVIPHERVNQALKSDFHILSNIKSDKKNSKHQLTLGVGTTVLLTLAALGQLDLFLFLTLFLILLIGIGYISTYQIKRDFKLSLYVILVSSLIIGKVFIDSGLSEVLSSYLYEATKGFGAPGLLLGLMIFTVLLTSMITNVAAVSITFPLAYSLAQSVDFSEKALYLAIAFAASAAFSTPIGYQTNLLVMAPGNYVFKDYIKIGLPLTIIYLVVVWWYLIYLY
ncbi:MAG: SLC13 family permease [Leeuwenhoekiella sp.]